MKPRKRPEDRQTARLDIPVTPAFREAIVALAEARGLTPTAMARLLLATGMEADRRMQQLHEINMRNAMALDSDRG